MSPWPARPRPWIRLALLLLVLLPLCGCNLLVEEFSFLDRLPPPVEQPTGTSQAP